MLFSETSFESPLKLCLYTIENRYNLASELELRCLFDASLSLLKAALHKDREYLEDKCANSYETRMGLLSVIKRYIRDELSDPGLSVNKVATKFGISGRYVHVLFQDEKTTFKDYITDLRLKQVRADLFDASKKNVTAIDIASRWGFQDKTTFHRNFKAYFGETPARLRAAALQAPGSDDF